MNGLPADLRAARLETSWGAIDVVAGELGVWRCALPWADGAEPGTLRVRKWSAGGAPKWLRLAMEHARAALEGSEPEEPVGAHPEVYGQATAFRAAAWKAIGKIERGKTATYGEIAAAAGRPGAARAAGGACGANPVPLFVPCHRVVARGGAGGFTGGKAWKAALLAREGAWR